MVSQENMSMKYLKDGISLFFSNKCVKSVGM